jgi:CheY-like chemotaxis protein
MIELRTILLAEDNPRDVELTLEAISGFKVVPKVEVVNDGVEAIEYLRCEGKYKGRKKIPLAVILLDIKMPRMDGIEVLQTIRSDPSFRALPVVMFTSSREKADVRRSYDLGANAYVVKPVNYKEFIRTIKNIGVFWASINELPIADYQ